MLQNFAFAEDFIRMEDYNPIVVPSDVSVSLSKNTYLVSNVVVSGVAESDTQAFDNGLYSAKFIAFRALKNTIQDSILSEDSDTIDSAIAGFVPVDGHFEDTKYTAKFEILFDKDKIASLITEAKIIGQQKSRSGGESIVAKISIKNDIKNWIKMRDRLDKSSIKYSIISLNLNEIELLFTKINITKLTNDLNDNNLELVQNRNFYFIKIPLFS